MDFLELIKTNNLTKLLSTGNFGLEKENLRTDINGNLALTPHPRVFGDKLTNPYITTDFAESQIEMITPALDSPQAAFEFMNVLHDIISLELTDEYLWSYSLPPVLPVDEHLIQAAQFNQPEITEYRNYLAKKYGKRKQLLSGIHYNFSFSQEFIEALYIAYNYTINDGSINSDNHANKFLTYREFNDDVYLKVAREYLKYSWLVIYLFGANSVVHESYLSCCRRSVEKITNDTYDFHGASSFRNGASGYRNINHFYVSYNSLSHYIDDIQSAINRGEIIAAKEYYSQIRLKGHSKSAILEDLAQDGINYIEIRTLDLNPLTKLGVTMEQMEFIHLLLMYCLLAPDFHMTSDDYKFANFNQLLAADSNRDEDIMLHFAPHMQKPLRSWGMELLQNMYDTLEGVGISADRLGVLLNYKRQLCHDKQSIASALVDGVKQMGYANFFMQQSLKFLSDTKLAHPFYQSNHDNGVVNGNNNDNDHGQGTHQGNQGAYISQILQTLKHSPA